jgi:hypothetical protein
MSHVHRPIPARRMYVEPRRGSFDPDYGSYCGDDRDPRWAGPVDCADCGGTKYAPDGSKCPYCNGIGTIPEDME